MEAVNRIMSIQKRILGLAGIGLFLAGAGWGSNYYVNDANTNGDVYTSAVGVDAPGRGTTPADPLLSLAYLLNIYDLNGGDTVYVDTGIYSNQTTTIAASQSGGAGNPMTIQGSTNYFYSGGTVFDGGSFDLVASSCRLQDFAFKRSSVGYGLSVYGNSNEVYRVLSERHGGSGFYTLGFRNAFYNCVALNNAYGGSTELGGLYVYENRPTLWQGGLMLNNKFGMYADASLTISNSLILGGNMAFSRNTLPRGDHCVFWDTNIRDKQASITPLVNLLDLQLATTSFAHSVYADPQLAAADATNYYPRSLVGRYNPATGSWVTDTVHSVLIDLGSPFSTAFTNEPMPHGGRENVGLYSGMAQASKSRTNAWVMALSLNDGGEFSGTNRLYWNHGTNFPGGIATAKVDLAYSPNAGQTWITIASGVPLTNGYAGYAWDASAVTSTPAALWRVGAFALNAVDTNDAFFVIRGPTWAPAPICLYVNVTNPVGSAYCTAAGSFTNTGLSPAAPKSDLQQVLNVYDLGAGDIVYVDSGEYVLTNTVTLGYGDQGAAGAPLTIRGSTNGYGATVFNRQTALTNVFHVDRADYVSLQHFTVRNGNYGVYLNNALNTDLDRVLARNNNIGFRSEPAGLGAVATFSRCVAFSNLIGFSALTASNTWDYGVSWGNSLAAFVLASFNTVSVSNSVINGGAAFYGAVTPSNGDYNVFWNTTLGGGFTNLYAMQQDRRGWWHCLVQDPQLENPAALDFHPRSMNGRWSGGAWVTDAVHSVTIDLGDPRAPFAEEPLPNGSNVNVGVYGNTTEASRSLTGAWITALSYSDGGLLRGGNKNATTDTVYWVGANFQAGATVRVELSGDGGKTWSVAATNIAATNGYYIWASTNYPSSALFGRWRVVYEPNPALLASNAVNFEFRNGPFQYYVNDASTNGDVYCTAPGNDSNLGTTPGAPKASLTNLLATYGPIGGGDTVYLDTGLYPSQQFSAGQRDSAPVLIYLIGSTNKASGGTVLGGDPASGATPALTLDGAGYLDISDVTFRGRPTGLRLNGASNVRLTRVVARNNSVNGLWLENGATGVVVRHSVFWGNSNAAVRVDSGSVGITNSVVVAAGSEAYGYVAQSAAQILGNYNNFYAFSNALVGWIAALGRNQDTLAAWSGETGQERHSLGMDPLFADAGAGDFHPKTATPNGRYVFGAGFTGTDTETSPLIDSGNPASDFALEPADNGGRVDIGLYGNTGEASKGRTNAWLLAAVPREGGWMKGTGVFHWVAGRGATSQAVKVECSLDGGSTWTVLTNSVPAATETLGWKTLAVSNTPAAVWRVTSTTQPDLTDRTTNFFAVRNSSLSLFINDANTAGDIFTKGPGASTNWVASTTRPLDALASALACFDLEPGDTLFVDTGSYTNPVNARLARADSGSTGALLRITGSTNVTAGGSACYRQSGAAGAYGLHADAAGAVSVSNLAFFGAAVGIRMDAAENFSLNNVRSASNTSHGVELVRATNVSLTRVMLYQNAGRGLNASASWGVRCLQSVIWSNAQGAIALNGGEAAFRHDVLHAYGAGRYLYDVSGSGMVTSEYNDVWAAGGAGTARYGGQNYDTMIQWQTTTSNDLRSLTHDPLFAHTTAGDFHSRSEAGRVLPGVPGYTNDTVTSLLIDSGDPTAAFGLERTPNGGRLNIGPYGNSPEASLSRTNGWFVALTLNSGGSIRGTNDLYWLAGGVATSHAVSVQFSTNAGLTWVTLASNLAAGVTTYRWNTVPLETRPEVYWRVISDANTNFWDATDRSFVINNGSITYYVNDNSTANDVYTTAVGNFNNDGVSPGTPKASIVEVLNSYVMRPIDKIYVDTGLYPLSQDVLIRNLAGGATNRFLIQGSTNEAAGGSRLDFLARTNSLRIEESDGVHLRYMRIYNANQGVQVQLATNTLVEWVWTVNGVNGFALVSATNTEFRQCLAMGNSSYGLSHGDAAGGTLWQGGVLWSNQGAAVSLSSGNQGGSLAVRHSVLGVFGSGRYAYYLASTRVPLEADYNDIFLRQGALAGYLFVTPGPAVYYQSVSRWARDFGVDRHSLVEDPAFATPGSDFHLKSDAPQGRFVSGAGFTATDAFSSRLIDAGDPTAVYTNEPDPNGKRINIGLHGNTGEASKTATNGWLTLISLNDGGRAEGEVDLTWVAGGIVTSHTIKVDYSANGGATWTSVATAVSVAQGGYHWTSTWFQSSPIGSIRLSSLDQFWIVATNSVYFALRNTNLNYYVNDTNLEGDVYCTATGKVTNLGAFPDAPKLSLQNLLDAYDLEPGDTVYVDTGAYTPTGKVVVNWFDRGTATNRVMIQGSTNIIAGGTVFANYGLEINNADGVGVRHLTVSNAAVGIGIVDSDNCLVEWARALKNGSGFTVNNVTTAQFVHCTAWGCSAAGLTHGASSVGVSWRNGLLWSNTVGVTLGGNSLTLQDSIFGAFGPNRYAIQLEQNFNGTLNSDYNAFYLVNEAAAGVRLTQPKATVAQTVSRWTRDFGKDAHSLSGDPLFAAAAQRDFHLLSLAGRYDPAVTNYVFTDSATSPLLDAGNPLADFTLETSPNGGRLNVGVYGNSSEASLSPTNARLTVASLNDGGRAEGSLPLYWVAAGDATGYTVQVSYSYDGGATWTAIATAAAGAGGITWTSTLYQSSPVGSWRVQAVEDPAVFATNAVYFALRNTNLFYYVNDDNTAGDVYCSATGSTLNLGATPGTPKTLLQEVLDTYDLEPGDTVYVDTGRYSPTGTARIGRFDAGDATNRVTVQGSTNDAAGGSVITLQGLELNDAPYVTVRYLTFTNISTAVSLIQADQATLEWVGAVKGVNGFNLYDSDNVQLQHCMAREQTAAGLAHGFSSTNTVWSYGVLWSNRYAINLSGGALDTLEVHHSVMGAFGTDRYVYYYQNENARLTADYNDLYLSGGAYASYRQRGGVVLPDIKPNVSRWARDSGNDQHSLSHDPQFANAAAGDFHPRSRRGHYLPGVGYTNDAVTSPLIDSGSPVADYSEEPIPNGSRVDIGLYGNYFRASKTPTNAVLLAISWNDGGRVEGVTNLYWRAQGSATGQTVRLRYSADGGLTWSNVVTNVAAAAGTWLWDSTPFTSSIRGVWRVESESEAGAADSTDLPFALRNQPLYFYVNDNSIAGDVYCKTAGSVTNNGVTPGTPNNSLQYVLNTYDLEPADVVYVDTANFTTTAPLTFTQFDIGDSTNRVTVQGSTNDAAGGTVITKFGGGTLFDINQRQGIQLRNLNLRAGGSVVSCYQSHFLRLEWVRAENGENGFEFNNSDHAELNHCLARGHTRRGLWAKQSQDLAWNSGVLWSNKYGSYVENSRVTLFNSAIGAVAPASFGHLFMSGSITSDYNNIYLANGGMAAAVVAGGLVGGGTTRYPTVFGWATMSGQDLRTLSANPRFFNADAGDYHLQSTAGRYQPGAGFVTNDTLSSVLIDAGNPAADYTNEPAPNGTRLNIGLYGNTTQESKTPTNGILAAVSLQDGGSIAGSFRLQWLATGAATSHTVRIDFSSDNGLTFTNLATNVSASAGGWLWDTTPYPNTPLGRWRITSEQDPYIYDVTESPFYVRNAGGIRFYVNDNSTVGDVYCTAMGLATNNGIRPGNPRSSIQGILDTYDLDASDIIYVDTGYYPLGSEVLIGDLDAGSATNRILIQGSTNLAAGGSVLDRQSPEDDTVALRLHETAGYLIRHLTLQGAGIGLRSYKSSGCLVENVVSKDNTVTGFSIEEGAVECRRCLAWKNGRRGVYISNGSVIWLNGVIWSESDSHAMDFSAGSAVVSNSVLRAYGEGSRVYNIGSSGSVVGDYNNLLRAEGAYIAQKNNVVGGDDYYETVSSWAARYGHDQHSLSHDPQFADIVNGDFHERSAMGRVLADGTWTNDPGIFSVLLDTAAPGLSYTNELAPNGLRPNLGLYGGTDQASLSQTNPWVLAISLNDGGMAPQTNILYWAVGGVATDAAVRIEYSPDNGIEWAPIATNIPVSTTTYTWNTSGKDLTIFGRWRVMTEGPATVGDTNDQPFAIRNQAVTYYVNDTSTVNDVYTSKIGNPTNSGLAPDQPLDLPTAILQKYPLGPDDAIYIDTGYYRLTNNLVFNELSRGASGFPIRVIGSTNLATGGTILDRASTNTASIGVTVQNSRYLELQHLKITGANRGVFGGNSIGCTIRWVETYSNQSHGVVLGMTDLNAPYCASWGNGGYGVSVGGGAGLRWDHGVIWSNGAGAVLAAGGSVVLSNSVAQVSKTSTNALYLFVLSQGSLVSDFNLLSAENGAGLARDEYYLVTYRNLKEWQDRVGSDTHSILGDPLFADASGGDFHPLSQGGRYRPDIGWTTNDSVTSWAVDGGDFAGAYASEPNPNGARLNIGLYGNTAEASLTPTNRQLLAVALNDGGAVKTNQVLYWISRGFATTDTVRLEVTLDGLTWTSIASSVSALASGYTWDPTGFGLSPGAYWRVVSEANTNIMDQTDAPFFLRVGKASFYVNDAAGPGDVYCSAPGAATNLGVTPGTPKDRIQGILDAYDIDPGDTIYVDTGTYLSTNTDVMTALDGGSTSGWVRILGSPNRLAGGTVLDRYTTSSQGSVGLGFSDVRNVLVSDFKIQNASIGVNLLRTQDCIFSNIIVRDSGPTLTADTAAGVLLSSCGSNTFARCVITRIRGNGMAVASSAAVLDRSIIWSNTKSAVTLQGNLRAYDSILHVTGVSNRCYSVSIGGFVEADYNNLLVENGAEYGARVAPDGVTLVPIEGLPQWIAATTQDVHSLGMDPLFADASADDYHLRSATGRYHPVMGWLTTDPQTSWLVDGGNPGASWTNEPDPNGGRRNIDLYGDTGEASMSRTNAWLLAITASSGGRAELTFYLVWSYGSLSNTNRVWLDYSWDNGVSWKRINAGDAVSISDGQYLWNSAAQISNVFVYPSSPIARWRVLLEANTNMYDTTDNFFALRNERFYYYVNDFSRTGDVYTSSIGNDTNLGIFASAPKASLNSLLTTLDVEGDDVILLDTGVYTNNAQLGIADEGKPALPVILQGSTNELATVFTNASLVIGGSQVDVRNLVFRSGSIQANRQGINFYDVTVTNGSMLLSGRDCAAYRSAVYNGSVHIGGTNILVSRMVIGQGGVSLSGCENATLENLLVYGSTSAAVSVNGGTQVRVSQATLAGGRSQYVQTGSSVAILENSILVADGLDNFCIYRTGGTLQSDYNNLVVRNGAWIGSYNGYWEKLLYWQRESGQDVHSMGIDPAFADEGGRDYHVKSTRGRWTPLGWTTDAVSSVCIDAGNPVSAWTNEPDPNGNRVNLGAYGNTEQASLTTTNAWLYALTVSDGGVLRGTNTLRWLGGNFGDGTTVTLQYSTNAGGVWLTIAGGVTASDYLYNWDTTTVTNSLFTRWRIVLDSDPSIVSVSEGIFAVRNAPMQFYVNNTNHVDGDVYTRAAGHATNNALSPFTPIDSLARLLSTYDTEGADTIWVDTGVYAPTSTVVYWSRGGDSVQGNVVVIGSTNFAAGGSQLSRGTTNAGMYAVNLKGSYVTLRHLTLSQSRNGVALEGMEHADLEGLLLVSNTLGIAVNTSRYVTVKNGRFWNNQGSTNDGGVLIRASENVTVENNSFYGNSYAAINAENSINLTLQNNIFGLTQPGSAAYHGNIQSPAVNVDYNLYELTGLLTSIYTTNADWMAWLRQITPYGHDYRSAIDNALFANPAAGDFHLRSTAGRYVDGAGWTNDAVTSWGVDRGYPYSDYTNEPSVNGGRINLGAYGNTPYASKGSTNMVVETRVLNDSEYIDQQNVWPLVWSVRNVNNTETFQVQYSGDNGTNWVTLATVPAYDEYIIWNSAPYYNTMHGYWRVVGTGNTNYWDRNDEAFKMFYGIYQISKIWREGDYLNVQWRGAWDEYYHVQFATNFGLQAESFIWQNATDGTDTYQKANFRSTQGGDFRFEDVDTPPTGSVRRVYRIWHGE